MIKLVKQERPEGIWAGELTICLTLFGYGCSKKVRL